MFFQLSVLSFLALRSEDENVFNGNYIFDQPGVLKYRSNTIRYERSDTKNEIAIDGPTEVPLQLLVSKSVVNYCKFIRI